MKLYHSVIAAIVTFSTATAIAACASSQSIVATADAPLVHKAQDPTLQWGPCPPILTGDCKIAVLHGDPSRANADVFLRVGGGYIIANHLHTSAERMILVSGQLQVQYKGFAPTLLTPGQYAYGPAGRAHGGSCVSSEPCTLFIAFEGPIDAEAFPSSLD